MENSVIDAIKLLTNWLHLHPEWASVIAFVVACTESLALIGAIIPGSVTMTGLGVLIGTGIIPGRPTFLWAVAGAFVGDAISYWIGHHFQDHLREIWPFRKYPNIIGRGETFFHAHGGKSIFIGRFFGPIRSILPLVAGMMNMPVKRFLLADIFSAFLWAPAYLLPGMLLGAASLELAPDLAARAIIFVLGTLILFWFVSWLIKCTSVWIATTIDRALNKLWNFMSTHKTLHPFTVMLRDPLHPEGHGQLALAIFLVISFLLFFSVAVGVYTHGSVTHWNHAVFHMLQALRHEAVDKVMVCFTILGDKKVLLPTVGLVFIWMVVQGYRRLAVHWLGNGILCAACIAIIKPIIASPRPEGFMLIRDSFSFPSGHTTLAMGIFGFFSLVITKETHEDYRLPVFFAMLLLVCTIALSRLYLGYHWFSDVMGALLLGAGCAMLSCISYRRGVANSISLTKTITAFFLSLLLVWSWFFTQDFQEQLYNTTPLRHTHTARFENWWRAEKLMLPAYRMGLTGNPIALFNLQWAAPLDTIKQSLKQHGWKQKPTNTFYTAVGRIIAKDKTQALPVFTQLHQTQRPVLVFTKTTGTHTPILVIRLWPSILKFSDSSLPLWVGTLHYRILWHHHWLRYHRKQTEQLPPASSILIPQLSDFRWKSYLYSTKITLRPNPEWKRAI